MDLLLITGYINKTLQKFLFWDVDVQKKHVRSETFKPYMIHCKSPDPIMGQYTEKLNTSCDVTLLLKDSQSVLLSQQKPMLLT